jgi:hypothetical protein
LGWVGWGELVWWVGGWLTVRPAGVEGGAVGAARRQCGPHRGPFQGPPNPHSSAHAKRGPAPEPTRMKRAGWEMEMPSRSTVFQPEAAESRRTSTYGGFGWGLVGVGCVLVWGLV